MRLDSTLGGKNISGSGHVLKPLPRSHGMFMWVGSGVKYGSLREGAGQDVKVWETCDLGSY